MAAVGGIVLAVLAAIYAGIGAVVATAAYALCLIIMLTVSALYNQAHPGAARPLLRRMDEAAIFLMIAGSYTPSPPRGSKGLVDRLHRPGLGGGAGRGGGQAGGTAHLRHLLEPGLSRFQLAGPCRRQAPDGHGSSDRAGPAGAGRPDLHRRRLRLHQPVGEVPPGDLARLRGHGGHGPLGGGAGRRGPGPAAIG